MKKKSVALFGPALLLTACATTTPPADTPPPVEDIVTAAEQPAVPARPFPNDSLHDLLVAEFALRRNRFDVALGNYMQQAHETRDPGVVARATRLAQFLKADNASLDGAALWTEVEPDNLEGQYTYATMLAKQGRPLEAVQHMLVVRDSGGQTNFAAIAASALRLDEQKRLELEQEYDRLLELTPQDPQLLTGKALLQQQRGDAEAALVTIRRVLKLEPEDLHAILVEARLLQQLGRENEAFSRLEQMVRQYPHNRRLRLQYARMLMGKDIEAAKKQFELLLATTPYDADLLLSLGLISKETGHTEDAKGYFQRLLETGERGNEAHYYLGQLEEDDQNWEQALDHYQQIPPGNDYMMAVGRITALYLQQDQAAKARRYLQEVRRNHPEYSVKLYLLESEVLLKVGDFKGGRALLTEALLIHPRQHSLLYARAMFSDKLGMYKSMEQDLTAIIEQDPNNAVALNALGYVLANRTQRLDEAYQLIKRALDIKPDDPAILDSLGWVEFRRGNLAHAVQLLSQAYQVYPDHEVAAHLGEVLWTLGERDQAIAVWQQALQANPDSPYILETVQRLGVEALLPEPPDAR